MSTTTYKDEYARLVEDPFVKTLLTITAQAESNNGNLPPTTTSYVSHAKNGDMVAVLVENDAFFMSALIKQNANLVVSRVIEFDLEGGLAGELSHMNRVRVNATSEIVAYTASFPWPLKSRWFLVLMRTAANNNGSFVIFSRDVHDDDIPPEHRDTVAKMITSCSKDGAIRAQCVGAAYHFHVVDEASLRVSRLMQFDMHIKLLPSVLEVRGLAHVYLQDFDKLRKPTVPGSKDEEMRKERLKNNAIYDAW